MRRGSSLRFMGMPTNLREGVLSDSRALAALGCGGGAEGSISATGLVTIATGLRGAFFFAVGLPRLITTLFFFAFAVAITFLRLLNWISLGRWGGCQRPVDTWHRF